MRIAAIRDGHLMDYALWRPGSPDGVGDVYRGRVTGVVPAMAGAFVAVPGGSSGRSDATEGFLPDSEGAKGLTEGALVTVRITRAAQGGKGPRLSARVNTRSGDNLTRFGDRGVADALAAGIHR